MAGVNIEIEFQDAAVQRVLWHLARFPTAGVREAFSDLGPHLVRSALARAKREQAPDGSAWAKLNAAYALRKTRLRPGAGILAFDRHLLGDQFSYQISGRTLRIGTAAKYGATQHFGSTKRGIPARPFIGFSAQDQIDIGDILMEHIERLARGS